MARYILYLSVMFQISLCWISTADNYGMAALNILLSTESNNIIQGTVPDFKNEGLVTERTAAAKTDFAIMFLFDVSGSMNDNSKMANAKQAAISTLGFLFQQAVANNQSPKVGIMSYSGECISNPTKKILDFTSDTVLIRNAILNSLPVPKGNTPTTQAIKIAEVMLQQQVQKSGQCEADLIILTDGQSTCGTIRPAGLYSRAETKSIMVPCRSNTNDYMVRYQTIGFDIKPGSDAEKDLQFLSSTHNGRYFHANDGEELKKVFEKISRKFVPIPTPQSTTKLSKEGAKLFAESVEYIKSRNYDTAFSILKSFTTKYPSDSAGIYNYAMMCEATEQYKPSIINYTKYLQQNPNVPEKAMIESTIARMRQYYPDQFAYQKKLVDSDINFMNNYYEKFTKGETVPMATEFTGFIKEKSTFYESLPGVLGTAEPKIQIMCKDVITGLKDVQRKINSNAVNWDQDAVPVISLVFFRLTKLNNMVAVAELK